MKVRKCLDWLQFSTLSIPTFSNSGLIVREQHAERAGIANYDWRAVMEPTGTFYHGKTEQQADRSSFLSTSTSHF